MRQKDELSCLITREAYTGQDVWEVSYATGNFMNENSVGLIIDGWVTWAANWNTNSGFTGSLKDKYGDKPQSGIAKAPGKVYHRFRTEGGGDIPQHELDRAMLDRDDLEDGGLHFVDHKNRQARNNEAIIDNWTVIGVCHVVAWTDNEDKLTPEYDQKVMEAYKLIKQRFPKAKLVKCHID